jgi:hypothetical protein
MNISNRYRPGTINVTVNGIQIEDLYQSWEARERECRELREKVAFQNGMLKKQGQIINELKEKIKENKEK